MTRSTFENRKKTIRRNILNLAFLALLLVVLLAGLLVTVVFPHEINEYENRYAEKIPRIRIAAVRDGSFQDGVEDAFADQLPFAEKMKAVYNETFSKLTATMLPKLLTAGANTNPTPTPTRTDPGTPASNDPNATDPAMNDPNGGQTANDPNGQTNTGADDPNHGGTTDPDPNGGTASPDPNGQTTPGPNNGQTPDPTPAGPGTSETIPVRSYPHAPLPDVPVQPHVYTAKKTSGGRIILTNMEPSEEIAYYVQMTNEVSLYRSHLLYSPYEFNYMKTAIKSHVDAINAWQALHPEVTCYAYFVERETELDFATNRKMLSSDYAMAVLDIPDDRKGVFRIDTYDELDTYYFKGDHHWNGFGAYEGYRQILKMMLPDEAPIVPTAVRSAGLANGSKTKGNASVYCEEMSGYAFDWPAIEVTINGTPYPDYGFLENYFAQTEQNPAAEGYTNYANCYGGDNGCTVLRNPASANGNILVIGESYDNAILKLLACHFTEVHSIDLRNYKAQLGTSFRFGEYIKANNITRVLWNGCLDFWTSGVFNPKD